MFFVSWFMKGEIMTVKEQERLGRISQFYPLLKKEKEEYDKEQRNQTYFEYIVEKYKNESGRFADSLRRVAWFFKEI